MATAPMVTRAVPLPSGGITQLSWPALIALHLIPGVLITAAFVAFAPFVERAGLPPIAALLIAIVGVLVPVELGDRREGRRPRTRCA